jgi:hypothetical protein
MTLGRRSRPAPGRPQTARRSASWCGCPRGRSRRPCGPCPPPGTGRAGPADREPGCARSRRRRRRNRSRAGVAGFRQQVDQPLDDRWLRDELGPAVHEPGQRRPCRAPPAALGRAEAAVPAGDHDAGGQPRDVPLPRAGQRLADVVDVEDQPPLGAGVPAGVEPVGVAAGPHGDPGDRRAGRIGGHAGRGPARRVWPGPRRPAPDPRKQNRTIPPLRMRTGGGPILIMLGNQDEPAAGAADPRRMPWTSRRPSIRCWRTTARC